ncbi:hypothetical protein MF271_19100 (plasmid) [Deinococcus sp. KNUC1210]|uniref:hypothetical protein n=1 Tax=Deinococcus sp. KNUC1210 TaxID=2917691 RepID=UPI001EEFAF24|nr:hypothetical protein [Deinococcus sp. KNUC1210]ULH17429.1 hypothetical protein MF271_19100 [Deinococcus sp. KNUC1210]
MNEQENREQGLREQIRRLEAAKAHLEARVRQLEQKLRMATPAPVKPKKPAWDHPVVVRPPQQNVVVTDVPADVARVARCIEEFVAKFPKGRCNRGDVSAAFPSDRAHLTAAYRHLHACKRVRVNGYSLELMPAKGAK